jgi:hypothetical protein
MTQRNATQWNVPRGPPLEAGARLIRVLDPAPWPEAIDASGWYALTWLDALDQAAPCSAPLVRDAQGLPLRRSLPLDRKYLPVHDLACPDGANVLVSERLARALVEAGASGFTLEAVPHVSPHPVSGHRAFRLEAAGRLGPLVDTQLVPPRGEDVRSSDPGWLPMQLALHPLCFDVSGWNGLDVCASPWFGLGRADWRYLLLPGRVLSAVAARLPDLGCGALPVRTRGTLPPRAAAPAAVRLPEEPAPQPLPLQASLAAVQARRERHLLPGGAPEAGLAALAAQAPFPLPGAYLELLRRFDGLMLYRTDWDPTAAALSVWPARQRAARVEHWLEGANSDPPGPGERVRSGAWFGIGEDVHGNVLWCLDAAGLVRAVGKEGLVYGPDTPFEVWLGDVVRDLDWAWDHPRAPGAAEFLARAPRM